MQIFASSPGWKDRSPMRSHRRLPLISVPTTGSMGASNSSTPTIMSVYLYPASLSMLRMTSSRMTRMATPPKSHMS